MFIPRTLEPAIRRMLFQGKVLILYGPRQVGKTTLAQNIAKDYGKVLNLSCDDPLTRQKLSNKDTVTLKALVQGYEFILIDEAQRVENIGLTLKQLVDTLPKTAQVMATGSSSFDLANKIKEPLTGRSREFTLLPFSLEELRAVENPLEQEATLEDKVLYGLYPEVSLKKEDRLYALKNITENYLYKDIFIFEGIRKPEWMEKIAQLLAISTGSLISYSELANTLDLSKQTVEHYIRILEQAFIIYTLRPYHNNLRSELTKKRKIYFYDTGIRNMLLSNFQPMDLRADKGGLWENFVVTERLKWASNHEHLTLKSHFWRSTTGQEVDLLEQENTKKRAFEIKWNSEKKQKIPSQFLANYGKTPYTLIHRENFLEEIYK